MILIILEHFQSPQVKEKIAEIFSGKMINLEASKGTVLPLLMGLVVKRKGIH